jgi:hypothetical protein
MNIEGFIEIPKTYQDYDKFFEFIKDYHYKEESRSSKVGNDLEESFVFPAVRRTD